MNTKPNHSEAMEQSIDWRLNYISLELVAPSVIVECVDKDGRIFNYKARKLDDGKVYGTLCEEFKDIATPYVELRELTSRGLAQLIDRVNFEDYFTGLWTVPYGI
jgi:hypothetical protein